MELEDLRKLSKKLKGVTEDIKWENHLCFCVGDKMFLIASLDEHPTSASFKVNDDEFDEICQREGFMPAPYLARNKWVRLDDINRLSPKEWQYYATVSYNYVKTKLTKKLKKELGIE